MSFSTTMIASKIIPNLSFKAAAATARNKTVRWNSHRPITSSVSLMADSAFTGGRQFGLVGAPKEDEARQYNVSARSYSTIYYRFTTSTLTSSSRLSSLPSHSTTNMTTRRWKQHSAKMGHHRETLEEMAHRPEREAAQERRQKKKERKVVKKSSKKGDGSSAIDDDIATKKDHHKADDAVDILDGDYDDDDDHHHDDNDDGDGETEEDGEPSLPDPDQVKARMMTIVARFEESLKTIRGAEPTPEMFDDVQVNAYGSMTPLKAVGQVVIVSNTLAQITCFDPSVAKDVQKAVQLALELNPQAGDEPGLIRVPLPRVSMEVREQTAKQLQKKHEAAKQRIRDVRRKAMDVVKKGKDGKLAGISKDDAFASGKDVDAVTEEVTATLKSIVDAKMDSIMAV